MSNLDPFENVEKWTDPRDNFALASMNPDGTPHVITPTTAPQGETGVTADWYYREPWTVWEQDGKWNIVVSSDKQIPKENEELVNPPPPEDDRFGIDLEDDSTTTEYVASGSQEPATTGKPAGEAVESAKNPFIVKQEASVEKAKNSWDKSKLELSDLEQEKYKRSDGKVVNLSEEIKHLEQVRDIDVSNMESANARVPVDADIVAMYKEKIAKQNKQIEDLKKKRSDIHEKKIPKAKEKVAKKEAAYNQAIKDSNTKIKQYIEENKSPRVKALESSVRKGFQAILDEAGKYYPPDFFTDYDKFDPSNPVTRSLVYEKDYKTSESPLIKMRVLVVANKAYVDMFPDKTDAQVNEGFEKYYEHEKAARYNVSYERARLNTVVASATRILEDKQYLLDTGFSGRVNGINMNDDAALLREIPQHIESLIQEQTKNKIYADYMSKMTSLEMTGEPAYINFYQNEDHGFVTFSYVVGDRVFFMRNGLSRFANLSPIQSKKIMFLFYYLADILADENMQVLDFVAKYYSGTELRPSDDKENPGDNLDSDSEKFDDLGIRREKFNKNRRISNVIDEEENSYLRRVKDLASAYSDAISKIDIGELIKAAVSCLHQKQLELSWPNPPNLLGTWTFPSFGKFDFLDWLERLSDAVDKAIRDALDQQVVDIMKELMRLLEEGCRDSVDYGKHKANDYLVWQKAKGNSYVSNSVEEETGTPLGEIVLALNHPDEVAQAKADHQKDIYINQPVAEFKSDVNQEARNLLDDVSATLNPTNMYYMLNGKPTESTTIQIVEVADNKWVDSFGHKYLYLPKLLNTTQKSKAFCKALQKYVVQEKLYALEQEIQSEPKEETASYPPKKRYICGDKQFVSKKIELYKNKGLSQQEAEEQANKDLERNKQLLIKYSDMLKNPNRKLVTPVLMDKKNEDGSVIKGVISSTPPELMYSVEKVMEPIFKYVVEELVQDTRKYFNATMAVTNPQEIAELMLGTRTQLTITISQALSLAVDEFLLANKSERVSLSNYSMLKTDTVSFGMPTEAFDGDTLYARVIRGTDSIVSEVKLSEELKQRVIEKTPDRIKGETPLSFPERYFGFLCSEAWKEVISNSVDLAKLEQYYADKVYQGIYDDLFGFALAQVKQNLSSVARPIEVKPFTIPGDDVLAADYTKQLDEYHDYLEQRDHYNFDEDKLSIKNLVKNVYAEHALDKIAPNAPRPMDIAFASGVVYARIRAMIIEVLFKTLSIQRAFDVTEVSMLKKGLTDRLQEEFGDSTAWYCREILRAQYKIAETSQPIPDLIEQMWSTTIDDAKDALYLKKASSFNAAFVRNLPLVSIARSDGGTRSRLFAANTTDTKAIEFSSIFKKPQNSLTNGQLIREKYVKLVGLDGTIEWIDPEKVITMFTLATPTDKVNNFYSEASYGLRLVYIPPVLPSVYENLSEQMPNVNIVDFQSMLNATTLPKTAINKRLFVVAEFSKWFPVSGNATDVMRNIYPISLAQYESPIAADLTLAQMVEIIQKHESNPAQLSFELADTPEWQELFKFCFPLEQILSVITLYVYDKNIELYGNFKRNAEACMNLFKVYTEQAGNKEQSEYIEKNK